MWFFSKYPSHLPFGGGKYVPGAIDLMTNYRKDGLFIRLYYPTDLPGKITEYVSRWLPWVVGNNYIEGFAKVSYVWVIVVRLLLWWYSGTAHIPIVYGAKPKRNDRLKCIVFSHGLGGTRYMYSTICVDLASRGFVVACLEHRDQSACSTYYYNSEENAKNNIKTFIEHIHVDFGEEHYAVRNQQVTYRSEEVRQAIDLLHDMHKGDRLRNILEHVPTETGVEFEPEMFQGGLDLNNLIVMGHSFGGATSLLALRNDKRIKIGVLLDPWMFPIKNVPKIVEMVKQPLLFINTQTFHIESNVKAMEKYMTANEEKRSMFTMLHTTHECQCDTPFTVGYWLNLFMRKLSPLQATHINNHLVLRFMNKHIGFPESVEESEQFLQSEAHNIAEGLTKPWG